MDRFRLLLLTVALDSRSGDAWTPCVSLDLRFLDVEGDFEVVDAGGAKKLAKVFCESDSDDLPFDLLESLLLLLELVAFLAAVVRS